MTEIHEHDAIVIGAGLAGLAAALKLQAAGVDAQVIEAQDRVGGRVHSMRQLGSNKEAGGTYIGAGISPEEARGGTSAPCHPLLPDRRRL